MLETDDRRPFPQNADELGLTQGAFDASQAELEKKVSAYAGEEREKGHNEYIIFATEADQQKALKLVQDFRQQDEAFFYLRTWQRDTLKPTTGLALEFSKTPQGGTGVVKEFFSRHGIKLVEHYTSEQKVETQASQTPIRSQARIIEMPLREDTKNSKENTLPRAA